MADSKLVWTSDPDAAKRLREDGKLETARDAEPGKQTIRVGLDKKRRKGKTVTMAFGFQHTPDALAALATHLKKRCGAGGTSAPGEIEIQGDHVVTITAELAKLGYRLK
ncbi:MAG: translation initiation factor 1 [Acidobacteriota bacterium]|jgi:translation initiation factor 1|nr:translation initiation factor 1 [Acidobacteriota bacterium]